MNSPKPFIYLGNYMDGHFVIPKERDGEIVSINPGNTHDKIGTIPFSNEHVAAAVAAAKNAFPKWKALSYEERASYLQKLYKEIESNLDLISEVISRETGKPVWEAKQESQGLLGKITITLSEGKSLISGKEVLNAQPGILGRYRYKPKGVMVVVGPFNFPAHLPHGHIVPALYTGNTVIFKPSELTPTVGQLMTELFHRAQFPDGVFNLVQGEKEIGRRLCTDKDVDGILFTGSYEVGLKIKEQTLSHYWKTVVLEMGGKNASIVLDDAPFEKSIYENLKGAYLTTGQRCSATSRLILTEKIADRFLKSFHELSKKVKIGYAFENPFMGPLISQSALEKYLRFQGIAQREETELIMRGKPLELTHPGYYVSPSIYLIKDSKKSSTYLENEIFGPNVAVIIVKNIEDAIEEANRCSYGLVTSVFTNEKKSYEAVFQNAKTGLVNWNRSTVGGSSKLPFGGQGKSGNQFPTGLFAPLYCTYPVSCLEDSEPVSKEALLPGMPEIGSS